MYKKALVFLSPTIALFSLMGILLLLMFASGVAFSDESWDLIGFVLISIILYVIVVGASLITGYILYFKKENEYGKRLLYGALFLLIFISIISIVIGMIL